jgi:hypothetical protein
LAATVAKITGDSETNSPDDRAAARIIFAALGLTAVVCGFLSGLRTVGDFDLGWQLATGRWVVHQVSIPSTEIFSYTAAGQPWIYPVVQGFCFTGCSSSGDMQRFPGSRR